MWYLLAALAGLAVVAANDGALFYFDTGGYLVQGQSALAQMGLADAAAPAADNPNHPGGAEAGPTPDGQVVGSRSAIYSLLVAGLAAAGLLNAVVVLNLLAVGLAAWLAARVAVRVYGPPPSVPTAVALPILASSAGALPFYVAFLMPDIFAAILLLVIGTCSAFGARMRPWEMLLALGLAAAAVLVHPSHLLMAGLMLPVALLIELLLRRRGWWIAPGLVLLVLVIGATERLAFRSAVETITDAEVIYHPFLTARVIADGPGYSYLEDRCPEPALATCTLYQSLARSTDPGRLEATSVLFESSPEAGSYKLLPSEEQKRIADEQVAFFFAVLADQPFATVFAFLQNTLAQLGLYSVDMTIPTAAVAASVGRAADQPVGGRLAADRDWIAPLNAVHGALYVTSGALALTLLLWPGLVPPRLRIFGLMLGLGIVVNAFICGAVSQPADRYGARVVWLLPFAAVFLLMFSPLLRPARSRSPRS